MLGCAELSQARGSRAQPSCAFPPVCLLALHHTCVASPAAPFPHLVSGALQCPCPHTWGPPTYANHAPPRRQWAASTSCASCTRT